MNFEVKFAVCTTFAIQYDLEGNLLNNVLQENLDPLHWIFLNVFPQNGKTFILVAWLHIHSDFFYKFKKQLDQLSQTEIIAFLNNVLPTYTEHFALSPSLWKAQSEKAKKAFKEKFFNTMTSLPRKQNYLLQPLYDLCKKVASHDAGFDQADVNH